MIEKRECSIEVVKFKKSEEPGDYRFKWIINAYCGKRFPDRVSFTIHQKSDSITKNHAIQAAAVIAKEFKLIIRKDKFRFTEQKQQLEK